MRIRPTLTLAALLTLPVLALADDQPSTQQVMSEHKAEIDNHLANIDYQRKAIVDANMHLSSDEANAFWPIYNTYRTEAEKLSKQHLALIFDYAKAYNTGKVSDDAAKDIIKRAEKLQVQRQELRSKYIARIAKAVSPTRAMRFLQIEMQLDAMALLDIGREIPLAQ